MKEKQNIWPAGIKKTRQRESVLSILEASEKPLSAIEIHSKIEKDGNTVWMSTVYRILELFEKKNIVIKTNMINSEMAVYELNRSIHKHYAVCINCHKFITMDNCPMEKFTPNLDDDEFQITGHNLEIYGICKDCKYN